MAYFPIPESYYVSDLSARLDWMIDHYYPMFIKWIQDWVQAAQQPRFKRRIRFSTYEHFRADPNGFFESILAFLDIPLSYFEMPEKTQPRLNHFRSGQLNEWEKVFTPYQLQKTTDMISESLLGFFGWSRF